MILYLRWRSRPNDLWVLWKKEKAASYVSYSFAKKHTQQEEQFFYQSDY